ncbi:Streptomycin 3''-O-adenylyltransferase [Klebsiella quasipneumoniae subsp. similipneumoniae]|uniref:Uncharacterized protein n=5 Tax=Pseudomonadati TaxID=3379134 RepID=Q8KHT5_CAMJU|nr:unknown [Campylobacter jejuni]AAV59011.1 unknown [Pseudomonas aeruginosa]ABS17644.1 ORF11 [Acinetobacter baumannii]AGL46525.1 integron ORF11 [Pseudomonas aeruginosa PA96]WHV02985.1 alpha/beta fold putative hydrolase EstX [Salmonella enterica subsp. enterica serovar Typhimurium var. monophasic 4,[5],12:i:-]CAH6663309.1 Streptothricin acetyl transferase [Pseudocitrobacter vendiensis]CAI4148154.1 alpha/beta fold putative hydrolase EstX [Escherichia coli]CAI6177421.1 alpha/beta fold putative 
MLRSRAVALKQS